MQLEVKTGLSDSATCPHCWSEFPVHQTKWVAAADDLLDDLRLGADHHQRFLPSRFDVNGNAIDVQGMVCHELACPNCHLKIPRSAIVFSPFFVSIAGAPACGKSFFLSSMTWMLRKTLPKQFGLLFNDSDGESNHILNDYEEQMFFNPEQARLVKLAKTDVVGDWYSLVRYEDQTISYPKPFFFDLRPSQAHPRYQNGDRIARMLCLYDNAGESYQPGADTVANPVTRHLGKAEAWLFCYDLTQDPRFRKAFEQDSADHQILEAPVTARQEIVLNEMINRIRRHSQLGQRDRSQRPLIIVCTKFDALGRQFDFDSLPAPWKERSDGTARLDHSAIQETSQRVRKLLDQYCPELVAASEALSERVYFVPVSATGIAPEKDPETGDYMMRTDRVNPRWCEVPFLLALALRAPKLVQAYQQAASAEPAS